MQKFLEKISSPVLFILIAAILRLAPHAPNFAPIGAMALFGGTYLGKKWAIILPLAAMFLSDLFIGFDGVDGRLAVYGSFLLVGLIGMWLKNHKSIQNVIGASIISSTVFFLVTNFTVLYTESLYPKTLAGLMESYTMALPFFRNSLVGDLFYVGVFFGGYELVQVLVKQKKLAFARTGVNNG